MSREKNLVKNTLIITLGTFLPKLTTLVTLPILTAYLTKTEYGTFDLISTLVSLILPVVTLKIEAAAFRFLIDCREDEEKAKEVISTIYVFLLPISIAVVLVLFFLNKSIVVETRVLLCLYFLLDIVFSTTQQIIRGLAMNMLYSISAIIYSVVNMIMIVLTVGNLKQGLDGVLSSMTVALAVAIVILFIPAGLNRMISLKSISGKNLKGMLSYSWPMIPNSLSSWVMNLSDRLIVTFFMGIEANAMYAVANKIPNLFNTLQGTFIFAWQENASIAVNDGDVGEYYSLMFDRLYTLLIGAMSGLIAITPILFKLLINDQYTEAYYQMPFLFGGMLFSAMSAFMGGIYVAHKKTKSVGITTMLAALSNIIINFAFIKWIGLYAASLSTFISYFVLTLFRMFDVQKFQRLKYNWRKIFIYSGVLLFLGVVCQINNLYLNVLNFILGVAFTLVICRDMILVMIKSVLKKFKIRDLKKYFSRKLM
jgi:O-antigen/teichoic acid export membrane protein